MMNFRGDIERDIYLGSPDRYACRFMTADYKYYHENEQNSYIS